ncbi:DUF1905 domain-containing protein [Erythrobacter sp. W53]|uniref:DUF1905 domain-containing protein n=1 Tax=Erythrobacter sp. W53 TaxID=3425947 RepID=UPI003D76A2CE
MSQSKLSCTGPLYRWTASNGVSWHFITIDGDAGEEMSATEAMRRLELGRKHGFRSLKVEATIGETTWQTSCFPNTSNDTSPGGDSDGWLLPIKAQVRKAEGIAEGDAAHVELELL